MLFAVIPLTISDSSIQLRPCSGSSAIWRRSMLPATRADERSTSGAWLLTVTVSSRLASRIVTGGTVALAPTSSSMPVSSAVAKPGSSIRSVYCAGRQVLELIAAVDAGDFHGLAARR